MNLDELKKRKRWVCYIIIEKDGKKTKIPISAVTGKAADCTKESDWDTYENCVKFAKKRGLPGVGVVLNNDDFTCVDLDNCISDNGEMNEDAQKIINELNTYTERSVSGKGVHLFLYTDQSFSKTRSSKTKIPIEIYKKGRFMVFTNDVMNDKGFEERSEELRKVYNNYFIIYPCIESIKKNDYDYEKFKKLNKKDFSDYDDNHSSADLAYMHILSHHVTNREELDIIFRASPMCRDKYLNRQDYREGLFNKVQKNVDKNYKEKKKEVEKSQVLTDDDVCRMVHKKYRENFVYNVDTNKYLFYNGNYYKTDNIFMLNKCSKVVVRQFLKNCDWSEKTKNQVKKDYLGAKGSKNIQAVYREIGNVARQQKDFNKHKHLLCCKNGMINLKTGELLPPSRDYMFTHFTDINYNPDAKPEGSVFENFMYTVTNGDKEKIYYLQILAGYCLTGETREQSFYFFIGPAATGKSVMAKILSMISGTFAYTLPSNVFDSKNNNELTYMAQGSDKRLIIISEQDSNTKMNTSFLKQLTGEDKSNARHLYSEIFDYIPEFKILFCSNEVPYMDGDQESVKRRFKAIPFENVIPPDERDQNLMEKLEAEKEIILAWAVEGAKIFYKDGFTEPAFLEETTNKIFREQNPLAAWIEDNYEFDENGFVASQDLWSDYSNYCEINKTYKSYKTLDGLIKGLKNKYGFKSKEKDKRGLEGLKPKEQF